MKIKVFIYLLVGLVLVSFSFRTQKKNSQQYPNILIAISDDQSWPHAGAYGSKMVLTPGFDRIAEEGMLFNNAFVTSPGCAPSRASILTGRMPWQNEEAGGHQTLYPIEYQGFPDVLASLGYHVGLTGKGTGPNEYYLSNWEHNPAGPPYQDKVYNANNDTRPSKAIRNTDYAANFKDFIAKKKDGQPFYFWYGASEPHRAFEVGSGLKNGKTLEMAEVPAFLPDCTSVRIDLLDYALEIDWFDKHLVEMIRVLEEMGEMDNTIIIVTSDNGMAFPRAKANCYEYGLHVPLAIRYPKLVKAKQNTDALVSLADLAPTLFDMLGIDQPEQMKPITTTSFLDVLKDDKKQVDSKRKYITAGRERHSSSRWCNLGYPIRSLRTDDYLLIVNFYPERWPAGAPQMLSYGNPDSLQPLYGLKEDGTYVEAAFHDIDPALSKEFLIKQHNNSYIKPFFEASVAKRPYIELFNIKKDAACMQNLYFDPGYKSLGDSLYRQLLDVLHKQGDPRIAGPNPDIFENYQRFSQVRPFPRPDYIKQ